MKSYIGIFLLLLMFIFGNCYDAKAAGTGTSKNVMLTVGCNIFEFINNGIVRVIALGVILLMGFFLFVGKASLGLAGATIVGFALVFGAENILNLVMGTKSGKEFKCKDYIGGIS